MDNLSRWWHGEHHNLLTIRTVKARAKYAVSAPSLLGALSKVTLMDSLSRWWHGELLELLTLWSAKVLYQGSH